MKKVFLFFMIMLVFSASVFAASSKDVAGFFVNAPEKEVASYVSPAASIWDYSGYFVLLLVVLVVIYFVVNMKKSSVKTSSSKKVVKKKK